VLRVSAGNYGTTPNNTDEWDAAYTHSQDNWQAHDDYLRNNADDLTTGKLGIKRSPSYSLDVNSGTTDIVARFISTDDNASIRIQDNDTNTYLISKDSRLYISDGGVPDANSINFIPFLGNATFPGSVTVETNLYVTGTLSATHTSGLLNFDTHNNPNNYSASGYAQFIATLTRNCDIDYWKQAFLCHGTNNSSNYWTVNLVKVVTGGSNTTLATFNTYPQPGVAGSWDLNTESSIPAINNVGNSTGQSPVMFIQSIKVGSPGNLSLAGPAVYIS
jgi:hypothetical protein